MPRRLDPEKHKARRTLILEASIACFAPDGFHQTSPAQRRAEAVMSASALLQTIDRTATIVRAAPCPALGGRLHGPAPFPLAPGVFHPGRTG